MTTLQPISAANNKKIKIQPLQKAEYASIIDIIRRIKVIKGVAAKLSPFDRSCLRKSKSYNIIEENITNTEEYVGYI